MGAAVTKVGLSADQLSDHHTDLYIPTDKRITCQKTHRAANINTTTPPNNKLYRYHVYRVWNSVIEIKTAKPGMVTRCCAQMPFAQHPYRNPASIYDIVIIANISTSEDSNRRTRSNAGEEEK